jgi:hypothetical protein
VLLVPPDHHSAVGATVLNFFTGAQEWTITVFQERQTIDGGGGRQEPADPNRRAREAQYTIRIKEDATVDKLVADLNTLIAAGASDCEVKGARLPNAQKPKAHRVVKKEALHPLQPSTLGHHTSALLRSSSLSLTDRVFL